MFLCNRNICLLLILRLKHVVKEKTYWKRLDAFSFGKKTTQETDDDALGIKKKAPKCVSYRLTWTPRLLFFPNYFNDDVYSEL